ncbi:hypothetical protein GGR54DRAFT_596934 [Hypoxylon sp. NC1633]|nr:hypothetical protein GGR54DRAFT_596934 [Hypoxylon sp. NC1633]
MFKGGLTPLSVTSLGVAAVPSFRPIARDGMLHDQRHCIQREIVLRTCFYSLCMYIRTLKVLRYPIHMGQVGGVIMV